MRRVLIALVGLVVLLPATAWAAAPQVAATATTSESSNLNTHAINLPAGIVSGNLLVVVMGCRNATGVNALTGWTELIDTAASTAHMWIAYRVADGSEGATIAPVTTGTACAAGAVAYRITGQHASTVPEVGVTASDTTGANGAPNPPSLNPTNWDTPEDTLWIACETHAAGSGVTGWPYANNQAEGHGSGGVNGSAACATTESTAASVDPGTFTIANNVWMAQTIAVRPAGAGGGAGLIGGGIGSGGLLGH